MSFYKNYRLVEDARGFTLEIYLNPHSVEFSSELFEDDTENALGLDEQIKKLIQEKFSDVKINSVKLLIGTLVVGTLSFLPGANTFAAAATASAASGTVSPDTTATVTASSLYMRSSPSAASDIIHTLWKGNSVKIVGESNGWYQIKLSDGRTGWASGQYLNLGTTSLNGTATVSSGSLYMRSGPSTAYSIIHTLWKGNSVKIIGESDGWYQIKLSDGRTGWASSQYLSLNSPETARQEKVDAVIAYAMSFLGTPYVYGGDSPSDGGFDCSGLTQYVFGRYGYILNRVSKDQALNGTYVARGTTQPGDLVFYSFEGNGVISHVGIYLGDGKMINSPKTGDVVKITDVTTDYWTSRYVTSRRIIQ